MKNYKNIIKNIIRKESRICIVGLGYVGLPLAIEFIKKRFKVFGYDTDVSKIKNIQLGKSYISNFSDDIIKNMLKKNFYVTNKPSDLKSADIIIFCLPTPLNNSKNPDLRHITDCLKKFEPYFRENQVISFESTSYPGTTEEIFEKFILKNNRILGVNNYLIYSPEREDPGNKKFPIRKITKLVSAKTSNCLKVGIALYSQICKKIYPIQNFKVAEMAKLLENTYRAINIGFINELKKISNGFGIDIFDVIKAASTKPFGFQAFYPGPGVGGHCIPVDPIYLGWKSKKLKLKTNFIDLSSKINNSMPNYFVKKSELVLKKKYKNIKRFNFLILGVTYKKNIDDMRESPSLKIIDILIKNGHKVSYSDPFISDLKIKSLHLKSINLSRKKLKTFDVVAIITNHDQFNYNLIKNNSKLIIDTRGVFKIQKNIYRY